MNSAELEIYQAIREAQRRPAVMRYLCLICKGYLSDWDVLNGKAVCWECRNIHFVPPKIELLGPQQVPQKATLLQLRDGKFAIIVE